MDNAMHDQQHAASLAKQVLARAAIVAAILGTTLTLLNQPNAIFGPARVQWLSLFLVYVTPFLVVGASQTLGIRQARKRLASRATFREGLAATLMSHGIPRAPLFSASRPVASTPSSSRLTASRPGGASIRCQSP